MEKSIRPVMLAAIVVWLMPLSAWAYNPPRGTFSDENVYIFEGSCQDVTRRKAARLSLNRDRTRWDCNAGYRDTLHGPRTIIIDMLVEARAPSPTTDLTQGECRSSGGRLEAGSCWYLGARGASCREVCDEAGGIYSTVTASYIGSRADGGDPWRCTRIARLFGGKRGKTILNAGDLGTQGCVLFRNKTFYFAHGPTLEDASRRAYNRLCACDRRSCAANDGWSVLEACWYIGELGESCETVCSDRTLIYDETTATAAGSTAQGGTLHNCNRLAFGLAAVTHTNDLVDDDPHLAPLGCTVSAGREGHFAQRFTVGPTTAQAHHFQRRRICACK